MSSAEAFVLLTLQNASFKFRGATDSESGTLNLLCVTILVPDSGSQRDVYLMLNVNNTEAAIDPLGKIEKEDIGESRKYTFQRTDTFPVDRVLTVSKTNQTEDLSTFENILSQYADFREVASSTSVGLQNPNIEFGDDLRGHLVAINEDTGEVLGQFDDSQFRVQEDPTMHERGHENDVVLIEVGTGAEQDASALEMFVRAVPPEEQDWITKSASIVSHAISQTTTLLLTTITAASSFYISHSTPSAHHPAVAKSRPASPSEVPPPRALVFLTSEKTRQGLANVHAVSSQAVKVSAKTVSLIDDMIRRAVGSRPKQPRRFVPQNSVALPKAVPATPGQVPPPLPPRLRKRDRVMLSLDLILSTLDHETRRLLNEGTTTVGAIMGHKYGPDAAHASMLFTETAKNVGLVYVDMRGIGRRALLRRAGTEFVKGRLRSKP